MAKLLRHYHFWGQLNTRSDPIPPAYNENDQVKYAGLYVAADARIVRLQAAVPRARPRLLPLTRRRPTVRTGLCRRHGLGAASASHGA